MSLNDEMKTYFGEIGKRKVLTREEEVALFKRLGTGDESARTELIEANLRFVVKIALSFAGRGVSLPDLIQEGNLGLIDVLDKFDYRKGYRFSTYAAFWIRQSIQIAVLKNSNVIRLPIRKSRMLGHVTEAMKQFREEHGRAPSTSEISARVGMEQGELENLMQFRDSVLSLDSESDDENGMLMHRLRDFDSPSPFEQCVEAERRERIQEVLESLTEKEQKILKLRYGFGTGQNLSLRSTSKLVGMSQEGVRRVEKKAIRKLRRPATRELVCGLL